MSENPLIHNPILATLSELLHHQVDVYKIEMGDPQDNNERLYRFLCHNHDDVDIFVPGTPTDLAKYHRQTKAYWDNFRSLQIPNEKS